MLFLIGRQTEEIYGKLCLLWLTLNKLCVESLILFQCNWGPGRVALGGTGDRHLTEQLIWDASRTPATGPLSPSGYGLPDDIVIEKRGKGDTFVDCSGADVRISCMKFVQHDAVEGILGGSLSAHVRWVRL